MINRLVDCAYQENNAQFTEQLESDNMFYLKIVIVIGFVLQHTFGQEDVYRLPNDTHPSAYEITIKTKLDKNDFKFNGEVKISIEIYQRTNVIILNSQGTKIQKEDVQLVNNSLNQQKVSISKVTTNEKTQQISIELLENLEKNNYYTLTIQYEAILREDKLGFYRSSYVNDDGEVVWLAATQFAPTQARHAFPCYDEPSFKAKFHVKINHPGGLKAISNTKFVDVITENDGTKTTSFAQTPLMSTYLVGFAIFDFQHSTKQISEPQALEQHFYVRENCNELIPFAEEFAFEVYQKFRSLFVFDTYLGVLQQVALPDFYFSGMENWAMITYKESRVFYNENTHSVNNKISIANLLAHEMAHQWFGNLVTMSWWTHVWMKEGFATLYEYLGPDLVHPSWNTMDLFRIKKLHSVLLVDSDRNVRKLSNYVELLADIMTNYDRIAYDKGGCVLHMVMHAIGETRFKLAVNSYLNQWAFNSVQEDDLFDSIQSIDAGFEVNKDLNITAFLKTWTSQSGYPVISIDRDYSKSGFQVFQQRFVDDGEHDIESIWWVPLNFIISSTVDFQSTSPDLWLSEPNKSVDAEILKKSWDKDDWIIVNSQQTGYYRVNYDERNWKLIAEALQKDHSVIHKLNRAQLIDDVFNLAFADLTKISTAFEMIKYLFNENEYAPWAAFENAYSVLKKYFSNSEEYQNFVEYLRRIVEPAYERIGLIAKASDLIIDKLTRQIVVNLACDLGIENCLVSETIYNFPDMRSVYFCNQLRGKNSSRFGEIRNFLKSETDLSVRSDIISSLGCTKNEIDLTTLVLISIRNSPEYHFNVDERLALIQSVYRRSNAGIQLVLNMISSTSLSSFPKSAWTTLLLDFSKHIFEAEKTLTFLELLDKLRDILDAKDMAQAEVNEVKSLTWYGRNRNIVKDMNLLDPKSVGSGGNSIKLSSSIFIFSAVLYHITK